MKFQNLNPELTTELVSKCGFEFDGYYYVGNKCPAKLLLNADGGFDVSFQDPAAPQINLNVKRYAELVAFMTQTLSMYIEKRVELHKDQLKTPQDHRKFIADTVKDYYAFDEHVSMAMTFSAQGLAIIPNNEYTFSITNNQFNDFKVYATMTKEGAEDKKVEFEMECAAQCISWPFLVECAKEYQEEGYNVVIDAVKFVQDGNEIPFFGLGIQKLSQKKEEAKN